jgi:hypothetical protein
MLMLKQCPKCRGDLYLERDPLGHGGEIRCLQCGKVLGREEVRGLVARRPAGRVA